jgi:exodeoxyribonuclease-5
LTSQQKDAINKACEWYKSQSKQVFVLCGVAGSGKSTIVKEMISQLELNDENVRYVTFTGKAALVLRRKGNPASTIHKLQGSTYETLYFDLASLLNNQQISRDFLYRLVYVAVTRGKKKIKILY